MTGNAESAISLDQIVGNNEAIARLKLFASSVNNGAAKVKPLLVFGPPGTGKTAAISALCAEFSWNLVELNAGDYRDSETIERVLFPAASSRGIFGKKNLILLDEIDELAAKFDAGASKSLLELIKVSKNPIIFIANDMWDRNIMFLRSITEPIEFRKVDPKLIENLLARTAAEKRIGASKEIISAISQRCKGDVRSALNDLSVFENYDRSEEDLMHEIGMRNIKNDIFSTLDKIFFSNTLTAPLIAITDSDVEKDMLIRWVEENIARRYKRNIEIKSAFDSLSNATLFSSRATMSQNYGFWRYMNVFMSSGIALSKIEYPSRSERYMFPKIITELSRAKPKKEKTRELVEKLKKRIHANSREITNFYIPLLERMAAIASKENPDNAEAFFENVYELKKEEFEALCG